MSLDIWIWVWVGLFLLLIGFEIFTYNIDVIWYIVGALDAMIMAILKVNYIIQICAFFDVSTNLLAL
ncbi:MAG: hypothetical protein ACK5HL_04060, partial [Bacilli bacterium]